MSDAILDGEMLDVLGSLVPADEVRPELRSDGLRVLNVGKPDRVGHLGVGHPLGGVVDHDNGVLAPHQKPKSHLHIAHGLVLPGLANEVVRNPGQTGNHEVVLESLVLPEIEKLSISCSLELKDSAKTTMILFQDHDAILENTICLTRLLGDGRNGQRQVLQGDLGRVEQVKDKLQTGIRSEMNSIGLERGGGKARKQDQVVGLVGVKQLREDCQDLRKPLTVPNRSHPIHGGRDHVEPVRVRGALVVKACQHILKHWLDALRNVRRPLG